jgi:hypothetical protein
MLEHARATAHRLGLDQSAFSQLLGLHVADRMNAEMQLGWARQQELQKLGPAAETRVAQISQWLRATVGSDSDPVVSMLSNFPHAQTLRAFEKLLSKFSNQGGAQFDQRGRVHEENGRIPGFENMSFQQQRIAQMNLQNRQGGGSGEKR